MSEHEGQISYYRDLVGPIIRRHGWILFAENLAGMTGPVAQLRALGAERLLLVAAMKGTGPLPESDEAVTQLIGLPAKPENTSHSFHLFESSLGDLSPSVASVINEWDPERSALSAGTIVLGDVPHVGGRRRYGRRDPRWAALEDKACVDEFWDRCGIARAPSSVVSSEPDALRCASEQLDQGQGTVWSGDASRFIHGGGTGTRWVRSSDQVSQTATAFAKEYGRVRVMPFLEGIPCSIHGIVFGDELAILRPVEMVILRRPRESEFVYAGYDSFWEPAPADWQAMRSIARRVGEHLRDLLGYRGPYTIDGVLTVDGFLPTELNPRFGGAMNLYSRALPDLPLEPLMWAAIEGERLDFRAEEFEALLLDSQKRQAGAGSHTVLPGPSPFGGETKSFALASSDNLSNSGELSDSGTFRLSEEGPSSGTLTVGQSTSGTFLRFVPDPILTPRGPSLAPVVLSAFACAERELGLPIAAGALVCAESVR